MPGHSTFLDTTQDDSETLPLGTTRDTVTTRSLPATPEAPSHVITVQEEVRLTSYQVKDLLLELMSFCHNSLSTGHQAHLLYSIYRSIGIKIDPKELLQKADWTVVIDASNINLVIQAKKKTVAAIRSTAATAEPAAKPNAERKVTKPKKEIRMRYEFPKVVEATLTDAQAALLLEFFLNRNQIIANDPKLRKKGWLANAQYLHLADPEVLGEESILQIAQAANVKKFLAQSIWKILYAEIDARIRDEPLKPEHWTFETNKKNLPEFDPKQPRNVANITAAMLFCPQRQSNLLTNPPTVPGAWKDNHPQFYHLSKHALFKGSDMILQLEDVVKAKIAQEEQAAKEKLPDTAAASMYPDPADESDEDDQDLKLPKDDSQSEEEEQEQPDSDSDSDSDSDDDEGSSNLKRAPQADPEPPARSKKIKKIKKDSAAAAAAAAAAAPKPIFSHSPAKGKKRAQVNLIGLD